MKSTRYLWIILAFLMSAMVSCIKLTLNEGQIILSLHEEPCDFTVTPADQTKTTAVNSLPSSLYWGATTGSGSEVPKWSSSSSAISSGNLYTGQYQTSSPTTYNYYVSNVPLSIGTTTSITATGGTSGTDVIAGRLSSSSTSPSVSLSHIFARTGSLSFTGLPEGISVVSSTWYIKTAGSNLGTAGTYNLTTGAWSSTSGLSSWTTFTGTTDMYVIPGTYSIRADFIDSNGHEYSQVADVSFTAGKICNIIATPTDIITIEIPWEEGSLQFNIITGGNLIWKTTSNSCAKEIWYKINESGWKNITSSSSGAQISVNAGDVVYLYGDNTGYGNSISDYNSFGVNSGCTFEATGNISSLLNYSESLSNYCFTGLFYGCTGLLKAPSFPYDVLKDYCYYAMFYGCTSLTTAPNLYAQELVSKCYAYMFYNCSSLNYIRADFITTPSTNYTDMWVGNVSSSGTFIKSMAASWSVRGNYGIPTGWTLRSEYPSMDLGYRDAQGRAVLFATYDILAGHDDNTSLPNEFRPGALFAWAETSCRYTSIFQNTINGGTFLPENTPYHNGTNEDTGFTKYVPESRPSFWGGSGSPDNKLVLELYDDAAYRWWGGDWRMPTKEIFDWLVDENNCTWSRVRRYDKDWNGRDAAKITGKGQFSSSFIYLPAFQVAYNNMVTQPGGYWSSNVSLGEGYYGPKAAYCLAYTVNYSEVQYISVSVKRRVMGCNIRAVKTVNL